MSEERSHFAQRIDERKFTLSRRGYDKREVRDYLEDLEQAFRELEGHARRTSQRVADLERDLSKARATEKVSVDNAMMAVFDAKDRILERARRKADEIVEGANAEAARIKGAAISGSGGAEAGEIEAARAQADEIVAAARREADRLRQDVGSEATEDLQAELDATTSQLRRAYADTSAAREELDAARKRIVELESGIDAPASEGLEQKFGELESHLSAARSDAERLENELAARDGQVATLKEAVTAAETALSESKSYVADTEAELATRTSRVAELEAELAQRTELPPAPAVDPEEIAEHLRELEAALVVSTASEDQSELVAELMRARVPGDESKLEELQAVATAAEERLAVAEETMRGLEAKLAEPAGDEDGSSEEADAVLAAAREEAEAIKAEAEEQAEQRAAKVIAKAREEADQVRETVATLTAQAEDARSAALRSKLEAEDLAEAQRSMGHARDDIVATAKSRAEEIEEEATRAAKALEEKAASRLEEAKQAADEVKSRSKEEAAAIVAAAKREADEILSEARSNAPDPAEDLNAMLAQAEQEVAVSEELRERRADLDRLEEELVERERQLAEQHAEAAKLIASRAGTVAEAPVVAEPEQSPSDAPVVDPIRADHGEAAAPTADLDADDDADPAERLSALLEQATPSAAASAPASPEEVDLDALSAEIDEVIGEPTVDAAVNEPDDSEDDSDEEPRPRMAWPTPGQQGEEGEGDERESRYRSRSAGLPRLGSQAKSNMTTMANLRKKSSDK